jgi:hypothetical protein
MFGIEVGDTHLFSQPFEVVEGSPPFLQGDRFNVYWKQLLVPPDGDGPFIPGFPGNADLIQRILYGKKVTTFGTIIQNLVSGIGGSTVDACEMVHGYVLVS